MHNQCNGYAIYKFIQYDLFTLYVIPNVTIYVKCYNALNGII